MPTITINVAGKAIDIEDIPMSVYAEIETATGVGWFTLLVNPLRHAAASVMLIEAAAKILEVDCPPLNPKTFLSTFEVVADADSRPEAYEDGLPVLGEDGSPLAVGGPQIG